MGKTKRFKRKSKTKKVKRGGRKQNMALQSTQNMALQSTQMIGGLQRKQYGGVGEPPPAPLTLLATYDEASVIESLQSFGDATVELERAIKTGAETSTALEDAVASQKLALDTLKVAVDQLNKSVTANTGASIGLYKKIVGSDFVETPQPPQPAPAAGP